MPHNAVGGDEQVDAVRLLLSRLEHELRSPLQAVDGFARLLRDRVPTDLTPLADLLCAGVAQLAGLVDELAATGTSLQSADTAPVTIGEVIDRVRAITQHLGTARNVRLVVDDEPREALVPDRPGATRLTQVLVNLVSNAVLASPDDSTVRVHVVRGEQGWTFTVTDLGPGVAPGDRAVMFEPFQRRSGRPGRGLGLYVVKTLVEGAGGTVGVDSGEDGRGARFVVQVPDTPAT